MPRLTALFTELEASLKLTTPTLTFGLGAKDIDLHGTHPRIVWVPADARHMAAEKSKANPRQLLTRAPTVVAHCWGGSFDDTEELVHNLIAAGYAAAWGSVEFVGEEWPADGITNDGVVALLRFAVRIPVNERAMNTVIPTTFQKDTTGSAQGDNNLDWGET